jgi:uncharacterized protein (DUF2141 family)
MRIRRLIALTAIGVGAYVLSACSNRSTETTSVAQPAASPTTASGTAAALPVAGGPATAPASPPESQSSAQLIIHVTDLRNHKGQLIFGVFKSADGFPADPAKSVNWQVKDADADTVTFTAALPPGAYGASVLHDENRNGKMDKNLAGIPEEGYGETNNPKPKFRAATFKESTFILPPEGITMTIRLQYF